MKQVKKYIVIWLIINLLGFVFFWSIEFVTEPSWREGPADFAERLVILWTLWFSAIFSLPFMILYALSSEVIVSYAGIEGIHSGFWIRIILGVLFSIGTIALCRIVETNLVLNWIQVVLSYVGATVLVVAWRFNPNRSSQ